MKILLLIISCAAFASCANNGNGTDTNGDSTSVQTPAVPNVNGNIPDTTNTITLNGTPDSAAQMQKDSMPR